MAVDFERFAHELTFMHEGSPRDLGGDLRAIETFRSQVRADRARVAKELTPYYAAMAVGFVTIFFLVGIPLLVWGYLGYRRLRVPYGAAAGADIDVRRLELAGALVERLAQLLPGQALLLGLDLRRGDHDQKVTRRRNELKATVTSFRDPWLELGATLPDGARLTLGFREDLRRREWTEQSPSSGRGSSSHSIRRTEDTLVSVIRATITPGPGGALIDPDTARDALEVPSSGRIGQYPPRLLEGAFSARAELKGPWALPGMSEWIGATLDALCEQQGIAAARLEAGAAADDPAALGLEQRRRMFRSLCAVALADRHVDPNERAVLDRYRRSLAIHPDDARALSREAARGEGLARDEEPAVWFLLTRAIVEVARADGQFHPAELERVQSIARAAGAPDRALQAAFAEGSSP